MSLEILLQKLSQQNLFAKKAGLQNIRKMCRLAGHPEKLLRFVHIAGTNGKGSVATKSAKGLETIYPRVGLYTSPHIAHYNERIQINGTPIPNDKFEKYLQQTYDLIEKHDIPATFFEIMTLIAFQYFLHQKVNIVVLETGLGGRFDATNVVTPELTIITSISLEHTEVLGNDIISIAKEKAGIMKPGVPVIISPSFPLVCLRGRKPIRIEGPFKTYDEENSAIARAALEYFHVPENSIQQALKALPPCRMEIKSNLPVPVIFDVAHNPDGIKRLFQSLKDKFNQRFHALCALSKTKDLEDCFTQMIPHIDYLTLTQAPAERAAPISTMLTHIPKTFPLHQQPNITLATQQALARAIEKNQPLVICGTFYIMDAAKKAIESYAQ